jgi:hypothetical protein
MYVNGRTPLTLDWLPLIKSGMYPNLGQVGYSTGPTKAQKLLKSSGKEEENVKDGELKLDKSLKTINPIPSTIPGADKTNA